MKTDGPVICSVEDEEGSGSGILIGSGESI